MLIGIQNNFGEKRSVYDFDGNLLITFYENILLTFYTLLIISTKLLLQLKIQIISCKIESVTHDWDFKFLLLFMILGTNWGGVTTLMAKDLLG